MIYLFSMLIIPTLSLQIREDDEEADADGANYQLEMMRCLREVNVDNNTVGWYVKLFSSDYIFIFNSLWNSRCHVEIFDMYLE